ncbi:hypothetical protein [Stappia sp. ES.058]|uniref:hypothetical protein n=1 Tax=Stappia sp. ES.058 TaxID=1881061 RepID=UPI000879D7DC|nr:hypothetical protein [Stappia sp. ES.058]SDT91294.1 hypothetical protein SAMN05428979_0337 [Stappia sp. ES.058]
MSALPLSPARASGDRPVPAPRSDSASENTRRFAELRVLAAGCRVRWGVSPNPAHRDPLLSAEARAVRLDALLVLWEAGYRQALDEDLYRDIAVRYPRMMSVFRNRLRRRPGVDGPARIPRTASGPPADIPRIA